MLNSSNLIHLPRTKHTKHIMKKPFLGIDLIIRKLNSTMWTKN